MVRKSGVRNAQFALDFADHQTLRMSGEKQLHDAQARLRAHGREHVGVLGDLLSGCFSLGGCHSSTIAEIWKLSRSSAYYLYSSMAFLGSEPARKSTSSSRTPLGSVTLVMLVFVEPVRGSATMTPRERRVATAERHILRPDADVAQTHGRSAVAGANSRNVSRVI